MVKIVFSDIKQTILASKSKLLYWFKSMAIFLNGQILPTGGVASGRVCAAACAAGLFNCTQIKMAYLSRILPNTSSIREVCNRLGNIFLTSLVGNH